MPPCPPPQPSSSWPQARGRACAPPCRRSCTRVCGRATGRLADHRRPRGRRRADRRDRLARARPLPRPPGRHRDRRPARGRTGPAARSAPRLDVIGESRDRRRPLRRQPARLRRVIAAPARHPHRERRRGDRDDRRARRPGHLRPHRPRRQTATSSASSRRRSPRATRPPSSSRSARSTPAPTSSTPRRSPTHSARITNDNAQGEYYLGDVLPLLREAGLRRRRPPRPRPGVNLGVNTRADLALVDGRRPPRDPRRATCSPASPSSTPAPPGSTPTSRSPPTRRSSPAPRCAASTTSAAGSVVGPHTTLIDSTVGEGASRRPLLPVDCDVVDGCNVGPVRLPAPRRATSREGVKAGAFVEIKNSEIGAGTKVPHLSYIGDADVGDGANLGAGTITANYDGFRKHRTRSATRCAIGVDTIARRPGKRRRRRLHWRRCR